jgi:lysozyme
MTEVARKKKTAKKARKRTVTAALRPIKAASALDIVVGIDVSEDQGTIDWSAAASSINFAIIKATDGVEADPNFQTNWTTARAAGVKTGVYHFFRNFHGAQEQFNQLSQTVTDPGDFPIALDVENTPKYKLKPQDVPVIGQLLSLIRGLYGKLPIIYTDNGSWASLGNPDSASGISFVECPLWIAYPTSNPSPQYPSPWTAWTFWQYNWKGSIPGIKTDVDLDRFAGNLTVLRRIAAAVSSEPRHN